MLKREFNYYEPFSTLNSDTFANSKEKVTYFGIDEKTSLSGSCNIEILFYNSNNDFALKLNTIEGEEIYLYKNSEIEKSFEEIYQEMIKKSNNYNGNTNFQENDILKIPFMNIKAEINYDELCGKYIKGTNMYIEQAMQNIDFELNNYGGCVKSEALIATTYGSILNIGREFNFNNEFLIYLKEKNKSIPYFAMKISNTEFLVLDN